jgi:hypothetical protein
MRARGAGLSLNAALALYGREASLPEVECEAVASLDRTSRGRGQARPPPVGHTIPKLPCIGMPSAG